MKETPAVGLLGPADVRQLAAALGVRPTKTLGQNFVHDPNTVRRIVATADLAPDDVVVEVGPGLGSLTLGLLPASGHVYAIEIDPNLAGALAATVAARAPDVAARLTVLQRDAMKVGRPDFTGAAPTTLVANLPYNVAVPVVLHLLAELPSLRHGLVMVQKEVADRLAAAPGSKTYGIPSVKLAWYATARPAGRVPPSVFWPVPNVDSGLVAFARHEPPAGADRLATFEVVDAAFAQRRKTLRAALAGWAGGASVAADILVAAGVDPASRGETLTVDEFAAIAAAGATSRVITPPPEPTIRPRAVRALKRHEPHLAAPTTPHDPTRESRPEKMEG
jgi:16S rRNA (adenine1518-N6/adenine1519-N6)-dimethyltransferase